jgi:hypothetical protein
LLLALRFISFLAQDIEVDGSMISRSKHKVNEKPAAAYKMETRMGFFLLFCGVTKTVSGENAISTLHNA